MTGKKHKAGVIGLGIMGRRMITNLVKHLRFSNPCAWDPNPKACTNAAAETPELTILDDADDVIGAADLVYIATPPLWHRDYAERAMAAGKPVYSEKPLGVDVAQSPRFGRRTGRQPYTQHR